MKFSWPQRLGGAGRRVQGAVRDLEGPLARWRGRRLHANPAAPLAEGAADAAAWSLWSRGVVDGGAGGRADGEAGEIGFERAGAFIYTRNTGEAPLPPAGAGGEPALLFVHIAGEPAPNGAAPGVVLERTWFALYQPVAGVAGAAGAEEPRGTALLMPGLFGTPEPVVEATVRSFREHGWAVLRMMSQPSRFTEAAELEIRAGDLEGSAAAVARLITDRTGECALAVEGAFDHVEMANPALAGLPRVVLGMSGGAMTLPTVVARDPGRYAAAVLVAGGADLYTVCTESNYAQMINAFQPRWTGVEGDGPTAEQKARFAAMYLERSSLDSYHTARAMLDTPVLMLHGTADRAVPAHLGDLLWERLGKPERWSSPFSHESLFFALPSGLEDIQKWLDTALRRRVR